MVWHSALRLQFTHHAPSGQTRLSHRTHQGVLRVQRALYPEPAPQQGICHIMLIYPPSGIAGGDNLALDIQLQPHSHAVITTPGANKWYGMPPTRLTNRLSRSGHQQTQMVLADHARLEWLPQETLFYNHTHATNINHICLDTNASFIGWEINVLGRQAYQENFSQGTLTLKTFFWRKNISNEENNQKSEDLPLLFSEILTQKFIGNQQNTDINSYNWQTSLIAQQNKRIFATLWAVPTVHQSNNLANWVAQLRKVIIRYQLDIEVTATTSVLLVRYLGNDVRACFSAFSLIRGELRRLMWNLDNHEPRIWAT